VNSGYCFKALGSLLTQVMVSSPEFFMNLGHGFKALGSLWTQATTKSWVLVNLGNTYKTISNPLFNFTTKPWVGPRHILGIRVEGLQVMAKPSHGFKPWVLYELRPQIRIQSLLRHILRVEVLELSNGIVIIWWHSKCYYITLPLLYTIVSPSL
jgi:hypothetical protein